MESRLPRFELICGRSWIHPGFLNWSLKTIFVDHTNITGIKLFHYYNDIVYEMSEEYDLCVSKDKNDYSLYVNLVTENHEISWSHFCLEWS